MAARRVWFAPKRFGYGSGFPVTWQGWMVYGTMTAISIALGLTFGFDSSIAQLGIAAVCLLPIPLIASRTAGGWKWRWGWTDDSNA